MQIVLHAGAHFTDEGKLLRSLKQNEDLLRQHGVAVPPPSTYRRQIRDTLSSMSNALMTTDHKGALMSDMVGQSQPERLVLSNDNFFGVPRRVIRNNMFFPNAEDRLRAVSSLFYGDEIEIFLSIRNPASFVPALVRAAPNHSVEEITDNCDPRQLYWSELIQRLREAVPHIPVIVWCNEDTPLIWDELLHELAGLETAVPMRGEMDLLHSIMEEEGMVRLVKFIDEHPGMTEIQKRRVIGAFLDKFALEDEIEEELDLPGWNAAMVDAMTDAYDDDVYRIEHIPGVTLVHP